MMSSRRRRRRNPLIGVIVVLAAIAAGTWLIWPSLQSGQDDAASSTPLAMTYAPETASVSGEQPSPAASTLPPAASSVPVEPPVATPPPPQPSSQPEPSQAVATAHSDAGTPDEANATPDPPTDTPAASDVAEADPAPQPPPSAMAQAAQLIRDGNLVQARVVLSDALRGGVLSNDQADQVRATAAALNEGLVFGPEITPGDPHTRLYEIKPGDALSRISGRENTGTSWRFIQRINDISDPARIRVGQRIKLVQGPFHARVDKQNHRLDIWLGEPDQAVYVRSFDVGLGEFGSTPLGAFRVRRGGKLVNPEWRNPRTGEYFASSNPENPIGEFWIGLDGIEPHNLQERGFGVHGTIDPESIGEDRSMGCVRLADGDIDLLYEMLSEGQSLVVVHGH